MINKLLLLALSLLGAASCSSKSGIGGTFTGLGNDTLLVNVHKLNGDFRFMPLKIDTLIVRNGRFFYDPQTDSLADISIYPVENIKRMGNLGFSSHPGGYIRLLYSPGERIRLTVHNENNILSLQAKGSFCDEQFALLHHPTPDTYADIVNNRIGYIFENPDEPLSAYLAAHLVSNYDLIEVLRQTGGLGPRAMESEMGKILLAELDKRQEEIGIISDEAWLRAQAQQAMIDRPAPDFTLKDRSRNDFTLSSLRGKYVLLDLWSDRSSFCLLAFPGMKAYYTAHADDFEIVGIAFDDEPEAWRATTEKYALPWINVIDETNAVANIYNITEAPDYVLIDREGVIVDFPFNPARAFEQLAELRQKGLHKTD